MTDDVAARLRAFLAEFPGISAFDPEDITELLNEHDQLRAENAQIGGLQNGIHNYEQWLAEECRKTEALQQQVARIRAFLEDMAGWCSPHGVAADYARRGLDALDGIDPLNETEAEIDAAMAAGEPVELVDLPELTREDALDLVDDLGQQAYGAQDRLAFIAEMCASAERDGSAIAVNRLRSWLAYSGCGGVIRLPETDEHPAGSVVPAAAEEHG